MQDINYTILIGNVTRDIELRKTQSGLSTCEFTLAVNRAKAKDGTQLTDWIKVVCWRELADTVSQYVHKGSKVAVVGSIQTRTYEKNGQTVYVTEVVANRVQFLSSPRDKPAETKQPDTKEPDIMTEVEDLDLPF